MQGAKKRCTQTPPTRTTPTDKRGCVSMEQFGRLREAVQKLDRTPAEMVAASKKATSCQEYSRLVDASGMLDRRTDAALSSPGSRLRGLTGREPRALTLRYFEAFDWSERERGFCVA